MFYLLAQDNSGSGTLAWLVERILQPSVLPFVLCIVAIITGGVISVIKMKIRHRERIAMIERGMNPDADGK